MGFRISVGPLLGDISGSMEAIDYSVTEASTPLAAGDSSGGTGSFSVVVSAPRGDGSTTTILGPRAVLDALGPEFFLDAGCTILDSRKGLTTGTITGFSYSRDGGTVTFTGSTRLGKLNAFGVQAEPFFGTLGDVFRYYLSLAGETTGIVVDPSIESRTVAFPGWYGELWYHLKEMVTSQGCEIALVAGDIHLRPIRTQIVGADQDTTRGSASTSGTLAQSIEIYQYNNRPMSNEIVYPEYPVTPEVQILNVNAGEEAEYVIELTASLSSFNYPVHVDFVPVDYIGINSVFTIVADDGLPVSSPPWLNFGGETSFTLNPDTKSMTVRMKGPVGLPLASGEQASTFSMALASDTTGSRYSTLRIVGSGVAFDKKLVRLPTGVEPSRTGTEVGVTIDNPFISTANELYNAGTRAARQYAGPSLSLSGNVLSMGKSNPAAFGNVQGARIFDPKTRRHYRIRDSSLTPGGVSFSVADDDFTYADFQASMAGLSYGSIQDDSFTYRQREFYGGPR